MKNLLLLVLSKVAATREATAQEDAQCVRERAAMVETIRAYARSDASVLGQQGLSERVLEAMGQTKRHLFIPERSCSIGYADSPIPIGHGQTMSQPFIVALMTQLAEVAPDHVVLEVGTGSGYQDDSAAERTGLSGGSTGPCKLEQPKNIHSEWRCESSFGM